MFLVGLFTFSACKTKVGPNIVEPIENDLPHIYINTEKGKAIVEKKTYIPSTIKVDGKEVYESFELIGEVRGRGNSTWEMPKKPYRFKLEEKASLFGLPAAKDWILLNEYIDGTLMYNSVPFKMGQLLEIPYTNTIIPVELTINNEYQGVYAFTEHKEVKSGRIDLGEGGLLLELDSHYDEDWQFKSEKYKLPVMISYPKSKNMDQGQFETIKADFEHLEALIYDEQFPNNNYLDYFDAQAFVDYILVNDLTANREINHPKSVYMNKLAGGKYRMGILWDFDWGYGFHENEIPHYDLITIHYPLLWDVDDVPGTNFFTKIMSDPAIKSLYKERWEYFLNNHYATLIDYVKYYAEITEIAYQNDQAAWGQRGASGDRMVDLDRVLIWLDKRVQYMTERSAEW